MATTLAPTSTEDVVNELPIAIGYDKAFGAVLLRCAGRLETVLRDRKR